MAKLTPHETAQAVAHLMAALAAAQQQGPSRSFASTGSRDAGSLLSNAELQARRSGAHYLYPMGQGRYTPDPRYNPQLRKPRGRQVWA